jgi:hypothetical protein
MNKNLSLRKKVEKIFTNKWIQILFSLILLASLIFYLRSIDQDIQDLFILKNKKYFVIAFPFVIISLLSHSLAWRLIINHFDNELGFWKSIFVYYLSNLSRYIPGNYWYIFIRSTLGVKHGIDLKTGFRGTGLELFLNAGVAGIFVLLGIILNIIRLDSIQLIWLALFFFIGLLLLLALYFIRKQGGSPAEANGRKSSIVERVKDEISELRSFEIKEIMKIVLLLSSTWISQGFSFYFILSVWNETSITNYFLIMFSYVTAWFLGFINPLAQNGLGVREAVFMVTINRIYPMQFIFGAGIAMRLLGLMGEIFLVGLSWLFTREKSSTIN